MEGACVCMQEFYCELCDKQYKTVGEMSNHLSSYDHHHTKVRHVELNIVVRERQWLKGLLICVCSV